VKEWFENKSICIVGNASHLFERDYGKEIDSYDLVVRTNKGFYNLNKKSQGSKMDVLAYSHFDLIKENLNNLKTDKLIQMSLKHRNKNELKNTVYYPEKSYNELVEKLGHNRPSTGLMIIDYILSCNPKSIDLYGFDFKKTPTYYEKDREMEPHNFHIEKKYVEKLKLKIND
jgi:hypothetical protein